MKEENAKQTAPTTPGIIRSETQSSKIHIPKPVEEIIEKTPRRVKGISRKFLLRAINRRIIVRLARRASIGIPLLGFYFAQNAFRNDLSQALDTENLPHIRSGYKVVAAIDGIDLTAQTFMLSGLVSTLFLQASDLSIIDLSMINFPEIMKYADKVSIGCALSSTLLGTYIELKKQHDLELHHEIPGESSTEKDSSTSKF